MEFQLEQLHQLNFREFQLSLEFFQLASLWVGAAGGAPGERPGSRGRGSARGAPGERLGSRFVKRLKVTVFQELSTACQLSANYLLTNLSAANTC